MKKLIDLWMDKVGRRGTTLIVFSTILTLTGLQYIFYTPSWMLLDNLKFALSLTGGNLWIWGLLFLVVAILGAIGAFRKNLETLAFTALSIANAVWSLFFFLGSVSGHDHGGWVRIIFHGVCAGFVLMIAGWPEIRHKK